jgi:hypothetical protein
MTQNPREEAPDVLECQIRAAAPRLPAGLRQQTLARCARAAAQQENARRRGSRGLVLAILGVVVTQWAIVAAMDSQNQSLLGRGAEGARFTTGTRTGTAGGLELILSQKSRERTALLALNADSDTSNALE